MRSNQSSLTRTCWLAGLAAILGLALLSTPTAPVDSTTTVVIVQGIDAAAAADAVRDVGGSITHDLGIIDAVGARLTEAQHSALAADPDVRAIFADSTVEVASAAAPGDSPYVHFPALMGADKLHDEGLTGRSVTVAVVDSGMQYSEELQKDSSLISRVNARYNAITDVLGKGLDKYGHGSHISSIIFNTDTSNESVPRYNGIAPDVRVVSVKAFDGSGAGTYSNVIRGLDWILTNKDVHDIRVLNLSFSAPPQSHYWDDPLNQAVMKLWQAGVVVVASAGNTGPDAMTIGVPGNVPYIITVGAMSDNYTPQDPTDDVLASFSAAGPTVEGFVKPDLVGPGGHVTALTRTKSRLATEHPEFHDNGKYFTMSGTSQAAAAVTGAAVLLLDAHPWMTPDQVKCRLMSSARPALDDQGSLAYSIFQQGAGLVNAYDAVHGTELECANRGLDIDKDLADVEHYGGRANRDQDGNYYIRGLSGYLWGDAYLWSDGYLWADAYLWSDGYLWADAYLWSDGYLWADAQATAYLWTDAYMWSDAYLWGDGFLEPDLAAASIATNTWVPQE